MDTEVAIATYVVCIIKLVDVVSLKVGSIQRRCPGQLLSMQQYIQYQDQACTSQTLSQLQNTHLSPFLPDQTRMAEH